MLTIGEFAQVGHVSSHLLRHYDRIGLLQPAYTDPHTSYRYYTLDQLPMLNRIISLKHFGLSLKEVARVLHTDTDIYAMLVDREAALRRQIEQEQQRLHELRSRLTIAENHGLDVVVKPIPALLVASYRTLISSGFEIRGLFYAVHDQLRKRRIRSGDAIGLFHLDSNIATYPDTDVMFTLANGRPITRGELPGNRCQDLEVCFVIDRPLKKPIPFRDGAITSRTLHAEPHMASVVHHGAMRQRGAAGNIFSKWVAETGYRVKSPIREVYLRDANRNDDDPNTIVDKQYPLLRKPS